jgi:hypothetical protein
LALALDALDIDVTMEKLQALAFVPPKVWQQVHVEGRTPAHVNLNVQTAGDKPSVHYHVEVSPRDARVNVTSIGLKAKGASGEVIIADQVVTLKDVRGRMAQGTITTSGDLNFRGEPTRMKFKVGVRDVVARDLPDSWKVPQSIRKLIGQLTGSADLTVTIQQGKAQTEGAGAGDIVRRWRDVQIKVPIHFSLHAGGARYRIGKPKEPAATVPTRATETPPSKAREAARTEANAPRLSWGPARAVNLLERAIHLGIQETSRALDVAMRGLSKLRKPTNPGETPTYLDVDFSLEDVDLAQVIRQFKLHLPYEITGRLTLQVHASIPINTVDDVKAYRLRGTAKLPRLTVAGLEMTQMEARVRYAEGVLHIEELRGQMPQPGLSKMDGTFAGSARVEVVPQGDLQAKLNVERVPLDVVLNWLPGAKVQGRGDLSGRFQAHAPLAQLRDPAAWHGSAELTARSIELLRVQGVAAERLKGTIDLRAGQISYRIQGESLGGKFTLQGDLPSQRKKPEKEKPASPEGQGRLEVRGAQLSRLWAAYKITGALSHLRGVFSIDLPYRNDGPNRMPVGSGTFRIANVRWDDELLGESFQGGVRLTADELMLRDVTGDFGQGLFRGQFAFGLTNRERGWFNVNLEQVEASRLLVPLPALAAKLRGPVDVSLRGRIGSEWSGSGEAALTRGQVFGLDVSEWRFPVQFSFSPTNASGELTIRDSRAQMARGRSTGEATLTWGNGLRLIGSVRFYQVDMRTLLRHVHEASSYASGRVSGRIDLGGSEMRSLDDLTANVHALLEQTQALQLPVLRQITPYLRPGTSTTTFQSGELKGRLSGGIFRVQRLTLAGNLLELIMEGTVNLAGRLNLDVTARAGVSTTNSSQLRGLGRRLPLVGAIPRIVLTEASALLANRVVHLRVTGTLQSPSIRIEPVLQLTEEAVRFFLGRAADRSSSSFR